MGSEAVSNGFVEIGNAGKSAKTVQKALEALESTKDVYAQELSKLKELNDLIPSKLEQVKDEPSPSSHSESPQCLALLENLLREREVLEEELRQQKARCEELLRELEQEHAEKLEAQVCLSVLNDTIKEALQGEKTLVERNRRLVAEQEFLASKLEEVTKSRVPAFQSQIKNLESACSSIRQEEVVLVLYNKVCERGLWVFLELVLFCHALLWFILRTVKETYTFAPT